MFILYGSTARMHVNSRQLKFKIVYLSCHVYIVKFQTVNISGNSLIALVTGPEQKQSLNVLFSP